MTVEEYAANGYEPYAARAEAAQTTEPQEPKSLFEKQTRRNRQDRPPTNLTDLQKAVEIAKQYENPCGIRSGLSQALAVRQGK